MRTKIYPITAEFLSDPRIQNHRRLETFAKKGLLCSHPGCHRVGTHVIHWYAPSDFKKFGDSGRGEHIDIIGFEANGTEYLMNVDHIYPRSKGGMDDISNKQPMCEAHNSLKSDRISTGLPPSTQIVHNCATPAK